MSTAMTVMPQDASALEKVLLQGDLSSLKTEERIQYYRELCASLDLNPLTKPFEYLEMKGQGGKNILTLYAKKDCTDQLRNKRHASSKIVSREVVEGVYVVTARASTPEGREEESIGAVPIMKEGGRWHKNGEGRNEFVSDGTFVPLRPEERANAMMKAETKAKRRATLSLFGLGFTTEEEVEGIPGARRVSVEDAHSGKLLSAPVAQAGDKGTTPAQDGASPQPDARPIPEELRDAVSKLRLGDIGVVKTASAFLQTSVVEACGTDGPWLKETAKLREAYPKPAVIPNEAMISMWLDVWAIVESARFAEAVNS